MYGQLPRVVSKRQIKVLESMFYLYMPIRLNRQSGGVTIPQRLHIFYPLIWDALQDFGPTNGHYIYITVKHGFISPGNLGNRPGYHSDGFMTEDINYIWCDCNPTVFNATAFNVTQDDVISLKEFEEQALKEYEVRYAPYSLLRLDQYNIHKVGELTESMMRTFVKISFSKDKYDLIGNTHNYSLNYDWEMHPRSITRNIPQTKIK